MSAISPLVKQMVVLGASDLHLTPGHEPLYRVGGDIRKVEGGEVMEAGQLAEMLFEIAPPQNVKEFEEQSDTDFAFEVAGVGRLRANLFRDKNGTSGAFRLIPSELMGLEELGLPDSVRSMCHLNKGLVVVTGPTGSGKSTTLASMTDYINTHREDHIITIEDPIEYLHPADKATINQREVVAVSSE